MSIDSWAYTFNESLHLVLIGADLIFAVLAFFWLTYTRLTNVVMRFAMWSVSVGLLGQAYWSMVYHVDGYEATRDLPHVWVFKDVGLMLIIGLFMYRSIITRNEDDKEIENAR